ncbi:MAG TPA: hypothetical protein VHR36_13975 [Pyrinomonadaceae bacterium]|nr:hypothetical protein [Pyrinomonadaceae bacterium]
MDNFPQQPLAPQSSGIKKQWIILGAVIGVLVIVMGGCVACGALIGLSSLTDSNVATTDPDDSDDSRRSSGRSSNGSGSGTLAGTTWSGTSNCDDGDKLQMVFKFAESGNPIYEYQTKSGLRSVELSEVGQLIRFVPPGGGVTSATVDSLDVSSDRVSHTMSFSTESSSGETLTQSRSRVGTETSIADGELQVETTIRSQSVSSQPGIVAPGDEHVIVCKGRLKEQ